MIRLLFRKVAAMLSGPSLWGRLFQGTLWVSALTLVVRAVAMGKDMLIASLFGSGAVLDQYLLAMLWPSLLVMLSMTPVEAAFVPLMLRLRNLAEQAAAAQLLAQLFSLSGLLMLVGGGIWWLALQNPWWPLPEAVHWLWLWTFPASIAYLGRGIANGLGCLRSAALAPGLTSLGMMAMLYWMTPSLSTLVWASIGGMCLEALLIMAVLVRQLGAIWPRWPSMSPNMQAFFQQYWPLLAGALIGNVAPLVDTLMASWLGPGAVSDLNYASKIPTVLGFLASAGISAVLLPMLAELAAQAQWQALRRVFFQALQLAGLMSGVLTIACVLLSPWLIEWIFQRGAFLPEDSLRISWIQTCYALQVPFLTLGIVAARLLSSTNNNQMLYRIAWQNLSVNILGNLLLMPFFGSAGIALSTSVVYLMSSIQLGRWAWNVLEVRSNVDKKSP